MSRIGKQPIGIPAGVKINVSDAAILIDGPKGKLTFPRTRGIEAKIEDGKLLISRSQDEKGLPAIHGLTRAIVSNMVLGVTKGFEKVLELEGVGYRAKMVGTDVELSVGFSNPVLYSVPAEIQVSVEGNNVVVIKGIDKQKVGQVASELRRVRPPEPYQGKGIRYRGEKIRRKAGKSGGK